MELNPNQPQTQTKVPPPPTPEVSVRTMQSDIRSISQGEVNPTPEVVSPRQAPSMDVQGLAPDIANQMLSEEEPAKKSHRGVWTLIIILIFIALAAVGFFVIYPMMSAPTVEPTPLAATPEPAIPEPIKKLHTSAFGGAMNAIPAVSLNLATLNREEIIQGLTSQGSFVGEGLTEVVIENAEGQVAFPQFLAALLPAFLDGSAAGTYTTDDFTAYLYKDKDGIWPGYIIPLKPEGTTTLNQWLANFEKTDLGALFVTLPGTLGAFKDGTVMGISDRFAPGTTPGASLSYAVTATDLHIATSFEGLKTALTALGY